MPETFSYTFGNSKINKKIDNDIAAIGDFKPFHIIKDPKFTPRARGRRIDAGRNDRFEFIRTYQIDPFEVQFNDMHKWIDVRYDKNGIWICLGSRKFAKTWFVKWAEIHDFCYQRYSYIGIFSEDIRLALKSIYSYEKICKSEKYELLQYDFELYNKIESLKEGNGLIINGTTFSAFSYRSSSRGTQGGGEGFDRLEKGRVDDWEDYANSNNRDVNERKKHSLLAEVYPSMSKDKKSLMILGNYLRHNCANALLKKEIGNKDNSLIYPCYNEKGESNWPGVYTVEELEEERKIVGELVFNTEYLQKPVSGSGMFDEKDLHFEPYRHFKDKLLRVIQFHDPAFSEKSSACYRACVTLGIDSDDHLYILAVRLSRTEYPEFLLQVYEDYVQYQAQCFFYENNGKQWDQKVSVFWNKFPYKNQMAISDYNVEGNKLVRIEGKLQQFKAKNVTINEHIRYTDDFKQWVYQYLNFPKPHYDGLDAFASAVIKIQSYAAIPKFHISKPKKSFNDS